MPFKVDTETRAVSGWRWRSGSLASTSRQGCQETGGPATERARIRTEVARELFAAEHGRPPADARELAGSDCETFPAGGADGRRLRPDLLPGQVGVDIVGGRRPQVAARIERAHQAAVQDALRFLEVQALFTGGAKGTGRSTSVALVAAAFTHRDSRSGDPDLHTHVAVANKVQTIGGRWLSIDGRVLFKATVAASETYNTALEQHLRDRLGVRFADRPDTDPRKPPVREIVGVDPRLNQRWSTRRM